MRTWLRDLWHAALLRTAIFDGLSSRSDAFLQGFIVIVAVALLVGLPGAIMDLANGLGEVPAVTESAEAESQVRQSVDRLLAGLNDLGLPVEAQAGIRLWAETGAAVGAQVAADVIALPTPLPRPIGSILQALGGWISRPLADGGLPLAAAGLGTWLGYGVWVLLFARLLGGRGTLHGFFGATALFAVPHLLDIFARVPYVGAALGIAAFIWGLLIYIKATAVSQQLTFERALLAVLLPVLAVALGVAVLIFGLLIMGLIVAAI